MFYGPALQTLTSNLSGLHLLKLTILPPLLLLQKCVTYSTNFLQAENAFVNEAKTTVGPHRRCDSMLYPLPFLLKHTNAHRNLDVDLISMCRSEPELSLNQPEAVCMTLTLIDNGKSLINGITLIFHEAVLSIYGTARVKRKEKLRCVKMKESLWGFIVWRPARLYSWC